MPQSDPLFDLVQSLDRGEKRYFRMQAKLQGGDKAYMKLFDVLDKQTVYDEKAMRQKLKGQQFSKQLHVTKNYLYGQILKSMRLYHERSSERNEVKTQLRDIEYLQEKGQYGPAMALLKRCRKQARKFDMLPTLIDLSGTELQMVMQHEPAQLIKATESCHAEQRALLQERQEFIRLNQLQNEIFTLQRSRPNGFRDELRTRFSHTIEELEAEGCRYPANFSVFVRYYDILIRYYMMLGRLDMVATAYQALMNEYDAKSYWKKEAATGYKIHLSNYLNVCRSNGNHREFQQKLEELQQAHCRTFDEEAEVFQNVCFHSLLYYMNTGKWQKAIAYVPEVREGMEKYGPKVNKARRLTLYFNIATLYWACADYDQALDWLNLIIQAKKDEHRQDIYHAAQLIQLVFHYELGNHYLIENLCQNTYRKLKKTNALTAAERSLINSMRKLPFEPDKQQKQQLLQALLEELKAAQVQERREGLAELILWTEASLKGTTMADLLDAKSAKEVAAT